MKKVNFKMLMFNIAIIASVGVALTSGLKIN